ncbi:alpha/beta hydrolase [Jannaschia sp. M317]|uniref:alpha/beta hydrolase n=1 Tax=Jannaschia sp. M317 TaxID=2867011 RepID=UPI0021A326D6|nr:alpha/beta hydrolase [Jannaschia sp. M317]
MPVVFPPHSPRQDWDDAFAQMAHIPGSEGLPDRWAADAAAARSALRCTCDLRYGPAPREMFDLLLPDGPPLGLAVFVHGGYWMMLDKSSWTHLARGALARGWAVCVPSYTLTPEARIAQITHQIARAITCAAAQVPGPIKLAGHSAGGHLVTRQLCADSSLPLDVAARITGTLAIAGLFDLRPLLHTAMNDTLRLDPPEARAESPALLDPRGQPRLTCWLGARERPEFLRQSRLMTLLWRGLDVPVNAHEAPGEDHFSVLDGLTAPDSPITEAWLGTA